MVQVDRGHACPLFRPRKDGRVKNSAENSHEAPWHNKLVYPLVEAKDIAPIPQFVCQDFRSSLKGLKTFTPGRLKSRSLPVAMVRP